MPGDRRGDDSALPVERCAGHAGPGPNPLGCLAAEQAHAQRRGDRRVGDPHLADGQRVDPRLDRHHAVGDGAGAFLLAHRRPVDDVAGRGLEAHLVDPEIGVDGAAQLVYRGPAGDEVLHHLRGHRGGIGRDAARRNAVIAGEHDGAWMVDARRVARLPGREPARQLLQAAERSDGLGQLSFAGRRGAAGFEIGPGQVRQEGADLVQAGGRLRHHAFRAQ